MNAKKPRKQAEKKPAAKKPAEKPARKPVMEPGKSSWLPDAKSADPVARAIAIGVKAFNGSKGDFADWIGIRRPNLSRAIKVAREQAEGKFTTDVPWPIEHTLKLAQISGVRPGEISPKFYEPQWKATRVKTPVV